MNAFTFKQFNASLIINVIFLFYAEIVICIKYIINLFLFST